MGFPSFGGVPERRGGLAPIETASFCSGVQNKRYSGERELAPKEFFSINQQPSTNNYLLLQIRKKKTNDSNNGKERTNVVDVLNGGVIRQNTQQCRTQCAHSERKSVE